MRRLMMTASLLAAMFLFTPPGTAKEEKADEDRWNVEDPPGEWISIAIDTEETTWSNVDVSPDGRTVVFDALGDIYTVPIGGGEAAALTDGIEWNFQPRYSPDGSSIAFVSDRGGANNIWIMKADGSEPRAVTEEKEHLVHNPGWSPDGDYVVAKKDFTSTRSIAAGEIWLFHAGGGGGLQITERPHGKRDQKTMAEPSFSVDGRYVYYSQDVSPGRIWQYNKDSTGGIFAIKRLDRTTGEIETFVGGPGGAIRPTPSPDGKYLAFVKRLPNMKSAIYLKDLESGLERAVHENLDRDLQETFGSQGNTAAIAWTPDAGSIVFWAGGKIRRVGVATKETVDIPVRLRVKKRIQPALRFPIEVAPEEIDVRMLRWAQLSPDGGTALFQALGRIWIKDLGSGQLRRLTDQTDHFEYYPSFSPDARSIVYTTWDDSELGSIRVAPASGGAGRVVSGSPGHYVEPRFSHDGESIVYRKITGGYLLSGEWSMEPGIHVVPSRGGESTRVSRTGSDPHFTAESDRVFFSDREEGTKLVLKSVNLDGKDARTHLTGDRVTEFSLSPDGRWVAFTEQYNAYIAPFTLTGRTVTIGSKEKSVPVKQVSKRSGEHLRWSADSKVLRWAHAATLYSRDLKDAFSFLEGSPEDLPEPVEEGLDLSFRAPADRPTGTLVLVGGRVVTMRDARETQEVIDNGVVVIEGNRIAEVGPRGQVPIPDNSVLIDVTGKTIIPGLLDVHAHGAHASAEIIPQQNRIQYSNLAFGVTTIHDPSNDTSSIFAAAEMQATGEIVAPRIFSTGTILYGAHQPGYTAAIETLDDARFHVRRLKDSGAITVKSYQQPRREQRQMVLAAARELGVMVVPEGGGKFQNNMNMIVDGHTGIEHSLSIATTYEDVLQLWSQNAVGYTPTLVVAFGGLSGENWWYQHYDVWKNERLLRYTPRFLIEPRAMRRTMAPGIHYNHIRLAEFGKRLVDRGGSVQIGAHGQREGLAAHWEMWMLHQGGFTPWEALRAATIDGARYLGLDGDVGSIEKDKLADLVVIDGNPLEDLGRSEHVVYTILDGRVYEAATMNRIAPDEVKREPFFFEKEGGDTIHPATHARIRAQQDRFGWTH